MPLPKSSIRLKGFGTFFAVQFRNLCIDLFFHQLYFVLQSLSVADPGCLSRIPDPKTATKEGGEQKLVVLPFFVATDFTKLKIILFLNCCRTKFGIIFKELQRFLSKKLSPSSQKYGFGIREKPTPDPRPGVKKASYPGSGSATLLPLK